MLWIMCSFIELARLGQLLIEIDKDVDENSF